MIEQFADFKYFPVVICASGPSFSDEQAVLIRQRRAENACRVIVINNNYRMVPNADILYAADHKWWKCHYQMRAVDGAPGIKAVAPNMARFSCEARVLQDFAPAHLIHVQGSRGIAASHDKHGKPLNHVVRGSGGGMQAVGLAIKLGAKHICLVGYDGKRGPRGESHWHGDHPKEHLPNPQPFLAWAEEYDSLAEPAAARGIRIVQCSRDHDTRKLITSTLERELYPDGQDSGNAAASGDALQI